MDPDAGRLIVPTSATPIADEVLKTSDGVPGPIKRGGRSIAGAAPAEFKTAFARAMRNINSNNEDPAVKARRRKKRISAKQARKRNR